MWLNLRRDIVELFVDAQRLVVELSVSVQIDRASQRRAMKREGFNPPRFGFKQRARERAQHSNFVVPVLPPPGDLCCSCGYSAHTPQQLGVHRFVRKCGRIGA